MQPHGAVGGAIGPPTVAKRQRIKYRSLGGGVYDADVLLVLADGRINIEAIIPPQYRVFLSRIVLASNVGYAEPGEAFVPA